MTIIDLKTKREVLPPPASVLCLGNFDGIHVGHMALINEANKQKKALLGRLDGAASGACFFRTPPSDYILDTPIPQLTSFDQKLRIFGECGLDLAFVLDFEEVGILSPSEFVTDILKSTCHCEFAVCGFNFHFGKNAAGSANMLKELMGGAVSIMSPVQVEGVVASSSTVRKRIAAGDMHQIPTILGRPYSIEAEVLHGKALGRTIGIPTINQYFPGNLAIPKLGIYITKTVVNGEAYPSVTNVGTRPSVNDGTRVNCETHILGFEGDLYGQTVTVQFLKRLRDEMRFESIDALKAQIQQDILQTQEYYKEA